MLLNRKAAATIATMFRCFGALGKGTVYRSLSSRSSTNFAAFSAPVPSCKTLQVDFYSHLYKNRSFHTTRPVCVAPVLWLLVRPAAKVLAVFGGRKFRVWWQSLNTAQREQFWNRYGRLFYTVLLGFSGAFAYYYFSHRQEVPYTKRKRFIAFTDEQFKKIVEFEQVAVLQQFYNRFLPADHPYTETVVKLTRKLTEANRDLPELPKVWSVGVVNDPLNDNAFCLPTGQVIVFSGLLESSENEDQLAAVLSHELAHVILSHSAEKVSFAQLIDYFVIVFMAAIWTVMPGDGIAIVTQWFFNKVLRIFVELPYSRLLEREADEVGLLLMAKACFDVREFARFWQILHEKQMISMDVSQQLQAVSADKSEVSKEAASESTFLSSLRELYELLASLDRGKRMQRTAVPMPEQSREVKLRSLDDKIAASSIDGRAVDKGQKFLMQLEELFNTHPAHYRREEYLNEKIPYAIALRRHHKCCELSDQDPRTRAINKETIRERIAAVPQPKLVMIGVEPSAVPPPASQNSDSSS